MLKRHNRLCALLAVCVPLLATAGERSGHPAGAGSTTGSGSPINTYTCTSGTTNLGDCATDNGLDPTAITTQWRFECGGTQVVCTNSEDFGRPACGVDGGTGNTEAFLLTEAPTGGICTRAPGTVTPTTNYTVSGCNGAVG